MNPSNNTLSILNSPNSHQQSGRIGSQTIPQQQPYQTSQNMNILQGLTRSQLAAPSHFSSYPQQQYHHPHSNTQAYQPQQPQSAIAEMANVLPPPPFYFSQKVGHLNWKMIDQTNTNQLASSLDINRLSNLIQNITYAKLEGADLQKLRDPNIIKIFKLYQLSIEYLLYIQNYYASVAKAKDNQYQATYQRSVDIQDQVKQQAKVISSIKQEIEYKKKHLVVYEQLMKMSTERNIRPVRCKLCQGKYFANQKYLNEHNKRRHKKFLKNTGEEQDDDVQQDQEKVREGDDLKKRKMTQLKQKNSVQVQEGQIVLKTQKQERADLAKQKQEMQRELRETTNNLISEKVNPLLQRILQLNNQRANQKKEIENIKQKLNQVENQKQEDQLIRKQESQQLRKKEQEAVNIQMKKLQSDLQQLKAQKANQQKQNVQVQRLKNQLSQREQSIRQMQISNEQKQSRNRARAEEEKNNQIQRIRATFQKNFNDLQKRNILQFQEKMKQLQIDHQEKALQHQKQKEKQREEYQSNMKRITSEFAEFKKANQSKPIANIEPSQIINNKDDDKEERL